jgi:hypothetical protein
MDDAAPLITTSAIDFREALPDGGVLLGLDLGTKTIGTALSDAGWRFATAGKTLQRGKFSRDLGLLEALATDRGAAGIVLGLPLNMDGSEGPRVQSARAYARAGLQPRQAGRTDRQPRRRGDPAGRARCAGRGQVLRAALPSSPRGRARVLRRAQDERIW